MTNKYNDIRKLASNLRYKNDKPLDNNTNLNNNIISIKDHLYRTGLLINENSTPDLSKKIMHVAEKLQVPTKSINAFIYSSSEIQASCIATNREECILSFSSGLINLLDFSEFAFVVGHELGHFIFGHNHNMIKKDSLESYMQDRAQEISVDRIGLIGCGDLNSSIRALIKTASGLESKFLKFDIGQFINQISKISQPNLGEGVSNSHPSIIIRCRALLWFSTLNSFKEFPNNNKNNEITEVDDKIEKDFNKYVDGPTKNLIKKAKTNLVMWLIVKEIIKDRKFDNNEQENFKTLFGINSLNKMKMFLSNTNSSELENTIIKRINSSRVELQKLIPITFNDEYKKLKSNVNKFF